MALLNKNKMSGDAAIASSNTKTSGTWLQNLTRKKLFWSLSVFAVILALVWLWYSNSIVATVGGQNITKSDYNEIKPRLEKFYQYSENQGALKDLKNSVLNYLIENKIIEVEAEKRGLTADPAEIQKRYQERVHAYKNEGEYLAAIKSTYDWTPELTKETIRHEILKEKLEPQVLAYRAGKSITIQHLTGGGLINMTEEAYKQRALKTAQRIKADIDSQGFDKVYALYSKPDLYAGTRPLNPLIVVGAPFNWEQNTQSVDKPALEAVWNSTAGSQTGIVTTPTFYGIFKIEQVGSGKYSSWENFINSYPHQSYPQRVSGWFKASANSIATLFKPERVGAVNCDNPDNCHANHMHGTIRDAQTGQPLYNASVHVFSTDNNPSCLNQPGDPTCKCGDKSKTDTTGTLGNYDFGIHNGPQCFVNCFYGGWRIEVSKAGYLDNNNWFNPQNGTEVDIDKSLTPLPPATIVVEAKNSSTNNNISCPISDGGGNLNNPGGSTTYSRDHDGDIDQTFVASGQCTGGGGATLEFDHWNNCDGGSGLNCHATVIRGRSQTITAVFAPQNNPQPPICSPSSQTVDVGQSISFTATQGDGSNYTWSAPGANPSSWVASNFTTSYSNPGTYSVTVTSAGQPSNPCQVTVNPPQTQVSCSISASPSSITQGNSSTLTWSSSGSPDSATLNPGGAVATSGSQTVSPSSTTTYTLTITKSGTAGASCSTTITVGNSNLGCVTSNGSSSITVSTGQSFTLTATGSNTMPPYVWLAGDANPASQSSSSTTFTASYATAGPRSVNVSSNNGTLAATCTVNVSTGPTTPTLTCTPPPDTATGGTVTFRADRTDSPGTFDWSGGGTPPTGSTPSGMTSFFDTSYSTTGPHTATVSSPGAGSVGCTVNIIPPPSTPPPSGSEPAGEIQFDQGERAPIY